MVARSARNLQPLLHNLVLRIVKATVVRCWRAGSVQRSPQELFERHGSRDHGKADHCGTGTFCAACNASLTVSTDCRGQ